MQSTQEEPQFRKITITLTTRDEARAFFGIMNSTKKSIFDGTHMADDGIACCNHRDFVEAALDHMNNYDF